jgi:hypothetical protein
VETTARVETAANMASTAMAATMAAALESMGRGGQAQSDQYSKDLRYDSSGHDFLHLALLMSSRVGLTHLLDWGCGGRRTMTYSA